MLCAGFPVFAAETAGEGEATAELQKPVVSAKSAVLLTADTGKLLFEENMDQRLPMASTTKIMTALIAVEEMETIGNPIVEITDEMVRVEGSSMGLRAGDRLGLEGIAGGMMMSSGNDAANSIALYLGGSAEGFAEMMNSRAAEIGMLNTNFVTASGLDDDEHYSTAYDMGLLGIEAMKNDILREICASQSIAVKFEAPVQTYHLKNHNKLLGMYNGCIGVKTGFTKKSGRCLVSAAERDGIRLIAVTINAPDDWNDHIKMLDYGFTQVTKRKFDESSFKMRIPVAGGETEEIFVQGIYGGEVTVMREAEDRLMRIVRLPRFLYAGIIKGETVGRIDYYSNGELVYSLPIKAAQDVKKAETRKEIWKRIFHRDYE